MRDIKSLRSFIETQLVQPFEKISVINLVDLLVEYAYSTKASDIHIEPTKKGTRLRFRIDGLLQDVFQKLVISEELNQEVISRIKVLSGLRTDEHFLPQDGRLKVKIEDFGDVDVRVSVMPTYYGENAIMRVLAETQNFGLEDLGFQDVDLKKIEAAIDKPYGMILANGPTGSGKTTTLYTILKRLNSSTASIITIEDPIEYSLEGTTQIQINETAGLTFANGLRSILRQDPNVIMVGEIRDTETAGISVQAALTGHLVLSTLHTNDAATTFPRLMDMGVPPFLVASTVNIAIGQRLVRTLCQKCKIKKVLSVSEAKSVAELIPEIGESDRVFYAPKGCDECGNTGYRGRMGIREVLEVNDEVRQLIMTRGNAGQIKEAAVKNGMTTMIKDGVEKALKGQTSIEEILRIIHE
ncbi:MAG: type II/IV secretion system protein [Patescibacteria group bacterium]|nr:GspE/PulE family protein [Patescibacteria group bacterium]MDE2015840.1 type II/IV secretion system protein [Patescibacteria group bacterium]MDE2227215.1 type II/IV secretion system protein [Patescibacteria group bacterium]